MTNAELDALFLGSVEPDCQNCAGECKCPGRVPVRTAMALVAEDLWDLDQDLFSLCEEGDARVHMCADGETGWAWWVVIDEEAIHPDAGEEVLGTEYIYPRDVERTP